MPELPAPESASPEPADFESRFPRRLMFATAAAGVAASVVAGAAPAEAAPATSPWLLGGNGSMTSDNFLGIKSPGIPIVFKTVAKTGDPLSEKMRLTALGRLGLGVTAPVARVDVVSNTVAIQGKSTNTAGTGRGVVGTATSGYGVEGSSAGARGVSGSAPNGYGVYGAGYYGVYGSSTNVGVYGSGAYGLFGFGDFYGLVAQCTAGAGNYAVFAGGDVYVTGTLSKAAGSFKIDHPLDPDNKWLSHSFVESPDMMNVYNGNITTGADGTATVTLPSYFSALNRDFRYQLTVIGQFAQAMVSKRVEGNSFGIKTDKPGVDVSWQVTGIRKDSYAAEHPIVVETAKDTKDRGTRQFVPAGSNAKAQEMPAPPTR